MLLWLYQAVFVVWSSNSTRHVAHVGVASCFLDLDAKSVGTHESRFKLPNAKCCFGIVSIGLRVFGRSGGLEGNRR